MKFKSDIEIQAGVEAGGSTGSNGQVLSSTGSGVAWVNQSADSTESVHTSVKNTSGAQILKGTPVYVTGETGNSGKIEIAPADASDSAKMPALGLLESTLDNNAEGFCVQGGLLETLATATIDGTATTANDTVYVKSGGGLTMTKPTGSGLIQNIAKVSRVHASNGSLVVSSILRTNDVPNLTTGKIWVGDGNTVESTVVHLDEANGRMGIGTTSPFSKLEIKGDTSNALLTLKSEDGGANDAFMRFFDESNGPSYSVGLDSSDEKFKIAYDTDGDSLTTGTRLVIDTLGNVGIGMTSPSEKLVVAGNIETSTAAGKIGFNVGDSYGDYPHYGLGKSNSASPVNLAGYYGVTIGSAGAERMRITQGGNVGIGIDSPEEKLSVDGNIAATGTITGSNLSGTNTGDQDLSGYLTTSGKAADSELLDGFDSSTSPTADTVAVRTANGDIAAREIILSSGLSTQTPTVLVSMYPTTNQLVRTTPEAVAASLNLSGTNTGDQDLSVYYTKTESDSRFFNVAGDTVTGTLTIDTGGDSSNALVIKGTSPTINLLDDDGGDDFYIHVNSNNFYVLVNRDANDIVGTGWESPHPLQIEGDTNVGYLFGNRIFADNYHPNADKWTTARTLSLAGDASGSVSWDGSGNASLTVTVNDDSHSHSKIYIPDTRGSARLPNYYDDKHAQYDFQNNSDTGAGGDGWHVLQTISPWSVYDDTHRQQQLAWTGTGGLKFRYATSETAWAGWQTLWTSGNDGSGSGLDADLLDGQHASAFALVSHTHTWASIPNNSVNAWGGLRHQTNNGYIDFGPANSSYAHIYTDRPNFYFNKQLLVNNNIVWNAGNDGAGSGLDADLLDGIDSANIVYGSGSRKTNNQDPNTAFNSGFYDIYQTNAPTSTWYSYLTMAHTNASNMHGHQIAGSFYSDGDLFNRHYDGNGSFGNWTRIWNAANDGSGSGLDADLLDGVQGSSYLRSDTSDTFTGTLTMSGSINFGSSNGNINLSRGGFITFYEDGNSSHGIGSRNNSGSEADDIRINSYGAVYINLDSNNNNTSGADFAIGRHGSATGTISELFRVSGETGNVGIGTTSPSQKLQVEGSAKFKTVNSTTPTLDLISTNNSDPFLRFYDESNGPGWCTGLDVSDEKYKISFDYDNDTVSSGTKLTIATNGNVGIGTTSPSQKLQVSGNIMTSTLYLNNSTSLYLGSAAFGTRVQVTSSGGLNVSQGSTYKPVYASAFTVSSDYRLKSNIVPLDNAISRLNQLEVHRFNWNDRLDEPKVDGFIAHEVATVIPEAVLGEKDGTFEDGTPDYQGIDQAKIVPLLTAALQDAITKIEQLETRIQTLENNG